MKSRDNAYTEKKCARNTSAIGVPLNGYLESLEYRRYSPRTCQVYGCALRDLDSFLASTGIEAARDVTMEDIVAYRRHLKERGFQPASLLVYMRAVRVFFRYLTSKRQVFIDPTMGMKIFEAPRKLQHVPTEQEVTRLLATPDTSTDIGCRDRAIMETAYGTGARRAEMAGMRLGDIDSENGTIRLRGKGEKERIVPLGRSAREWVERYIAGPRESFLTGRKNDALWIGKDGLPLGYGTYQHIVWQNAGAAGLKGRVSMHALRRACATHMLSRGASPVEIQHLLGHASMRHLSSYLRLTITELREVHAKSRPGS